MLKRHLQKLMRLENLNPVEVEQAINEIITVDNEAQVGAFMALLRAKGETVDELYGIVKVLRANMVKVDIDLPVLDIVGTGGDGSNTINISTGSAILAASCGVRVAKHGNRSVSSLSGSADVLEALGINIYLDKDAVAECVDKYNFGFIYAPHFHPALSQLKRIRRKLGVATTFNILGPLLNPANAGLLMIGVLSPDIMELVAGVLLKLNVQHAMVFHCAGLDEICCLDPIDIIEIKANSKNRFLLDPQAYGFAKCSLEDLRGGSAQENANALLEVFKGKTGPIADTIILNAGLANYLYGICASIEDGISLARNKHRQGCAYELTEKLIAFTNSMPTTMEVGNA